MIEYLEGTVVMASPTHLVIKTAGVGYGMDVSVTTGLEYQVIGSSATIYTYLHVKEDCLALYGFSTLQERDVFLALIDISGIGPKMAQRILSETTPSQLALIVKNDDIAALNRFKGVGKKTAPLLMLHLKSSFEKMSLMTQLSVTNSASSEAVSALIALGVKEGNAKKAIESAVKVLSDNASVQALITEGLKRV